MDLFYDAQNKFLVFTNLNKTVSHGIVVIFLKALSSFCYFDPSDPFMFYCVTYSILNRNLMRS